MSKGNYTILRSYNEGDILFASDFVAEHINHITNQNPVATGAYSDSPSQYRQTTNPGEINAEVYASSLAGEIERLRFTLAEIKSTLNGSAVSQWYTKSWSVTVANGTITNAKLADGSVSTAKIIDGAVTTAKLANLAVTTAKIADAAVTPGKLDRAYAQAAGTTTYQGNDGVTRTIALSSLTPAITGSPIFLFLLGQDGVWIVRAGAAPGSMYIHTNDPGGASDIRATADDDANLSLTGNNLNILGNGNVRANVNLRNYRVHCIF